jgi:hypothetical protein
MTYKLSSLLCLEFHGATSELEGLDSLDVRLGLEQIQDHPDFREQSVTVWESEKQQVDGIITDEVLADFQRVSPRHRVSTEAILAGLQEVINTEEFKNSCYLRWRAYDAQPWPTANDDWQDGVNLAAMPEGPMTA